VVTVDRTDPRYRRVWLVTVVVSVATFVFAILLARADTGPPLPVLADVPHFALKNERAEPVTEHSLRGKPFVADFFFTACPGSCPKLAARMAELQRIIRDRKLPLRLVSISVDPENDTPAALASYAARFGADAELWTFLTGGNSALERAFVRGFESCQKGPTPGQGSVESIMHGDWFVLVDGKGRIRGYYDTDDAGKLEAILRDAEFLARNPGA
jgi:protein SCO1/2